MPDDTTLALADAAGVPPELRQAWLAGYQFALTHLDDEPVRADMARYLQGRTDTVPDIPTERVGPTYMSLDYGPWEPSGLECGDIDTSHTDCTQPVMQRAVTGVYLSTRVALGVELEEHARHAEGGEGELAERVAAALTAEHYRRARAEIVASPEEHCAALAEAAVAFVATELERRTSGDVGRCGAHAPRMVPANGIKGAFCALPTSHAGWHRADDGCEWNAAAGSSPAVSAERIADLEAENERLQGLLQVATGFDFGSVEVRPHVDQWVCDFGPLEIYDTRDAALARARQLTQDQP